MATLLYLPRKSHTPPENVFRSSEVGLRQVRAVLFDLDGTLYPQIPSEHLGRAALHVADRMLEGDKRLAFWRAYHSLYHEFVSAGMHVYGDFRTGNITNDPAVISASNGNMQRVEDLGVLFKLGFVRAGLRVSKADLLLHLARVDVLRERGAVIEGQNDRLPRLMELLHGAKKFVLSNSPEITVEGVLKLLGVSEAFDGIYGSCRKPLGLGVAIDHVLETERIDPTNALYVGDSYGVEIAVARAMGLPAVYLDSKASERMLRRLASDVPDPALVITGTINSAYAYLVRR